jgi:Mor family transcriptional regulator
MAQYPESYLSIAEVIGEDAARALCAVFGGEAIYIPKLDSVENAQRVAAIRREYNGVNIPQLARKHNLTIRRVQQIVENERPVLPGQVNMFDAQAK